MKKFLSFLVMVLICGASFAQKATKEYQRPSLHMVLMTSSQDAVSNSSVAITDPEILGYVANSWDTYKFPKLYNEFKIDFKRTDVGAAKGSIMDLVATYNDPASLEGLDIAALKNIIEMTQGKAYLEALRGEVDKHSDEIAHQLVKKWWSISEDGSCSDSLIFRLACYSATQNQANDAAQNVLGAQNSLRNALEIPTLANTYVTCTKVDFYENEPIAKLIYNIMMLIASQTPSPLNAGVIAGADKAYAAAKEGYTAFANALLYKLEWNEEIANQFYSLWKADGHIDMEKFNAMKFNIVYAGATKASATCMMKKGDKGKGVEHMIEKTIYKALDKQFVDLQNAYEEFRPMVPILGLDSKGGIIADMGTKEGVNVGDSFNILYGEVNSKGVIEYKSKGTVKVVKWAGDQFVDGVWDNENIDNAASADVNGEGVEVIGSHLGKFKDANTSMFVKKTKK